MRERHSRPAAGARRPVRPAAPVAVLGRRVNWHPAARWYELPARHSPWQPAAALYAAAMHVRRGAYAGGWLRSEAAGRPVVVVGNLTVGGTGKTPLVIWLAQQLHARGLHVGIASRGHGGKTREPRAVHANSDWREVGDEPLLLARHSGARVCVARARVQAARALVRDGADVILTDDGLQHLALRRDCQVVVVDGARGFGNGRLLPAGPLREPLSQLAAADAVVINGEARHPSLARSLPADALRMDLAAGEAINLADGTRRALREFAGRPAQALAGIGNPQRFFEQLRGMGIGVTGHAFADHHPFTAADLAFDDGLPLLMTEKDAVKCSGFARANWWYVPVSAQLQAAQGQDLLARVLRHVSSGQQRQGGQPPLTR
ncbi:MAG: tetraacyldisaccharide 4'-kinase [Proteobacteria bacterium]|nr:tetraacyldisaccharide 4'-kinase [Pseudomonadota bacterium]